jgi:hypothetical protein
MEPFNRFFPVISNQTFRNLCGLSSLRSALDLALLSEIIMVDQGQNATKR